MDKEPQDPVNAEGKDNIDASELKVMVDNVEGRPDTRIRKPTEKYTEWQTEQCEREFRRRVSTWRRRAVNIQKLLSDFTDVSILKQQRDSLEEEMNYIVAAYERLDELTSERYIQERYDLVEQDNFKLVNDIGAHIRQVEIELSEVNSKVSKYTHRSRESVSSKSSRSSQLSDPMKRLETAAEAARLKTKLKYIDIESQKRAKLEKLQTTKKLEMAEASLEAIVKIEKEACLPHDLENGKNEYISNYIQSLDYTPVTSPVFPSTSTSVTLTTNPMSTSNYLYSVNLTQTEPTYVPGFNTSADVFVPRNAPASVTQHSLDYTPVTSSVFPSTSTSVTLTTNPMSTSNYLYSVNLTQTEPTYVPGFNTSVDVFVPRNAPASVTQPVCAPTQSTWSYMPGPKNLPIDGANFRQIPLPNNDVHNQMEVLADSFAKQVNLGRIPTPDPGIFSGDPLMYPGWKNAFQTLVESKGIPPAERIYYLKRYLGGVAKEAVEGYFLLPSEEAFTEAKCLLERRYGDPFVVSNAFRDKLDTWPRLPARDGSALRKLSDFLRQCSLAMNTIHSLDILNDERENRKLLVKLPEWLSLRWCRIVADWREKQQRFPPFREFVNFIGREADIACDPLTTYLPTKVNSKPSGREYKRTNANVSFHTEGTNVPESKNQEMTTELSNLCRYCQSNHNINECRGFKAKSLVQQKAFITEKRLCFGCLESGHMSKFCKQRRTCSICSKRHPTHLHGDVKPERRVDNTEEKHSSHKNISHARVSHLSGTDNTSKCSMIVPVWLLHQDAPENERLVYALLDTQSDTTFVLSDTCEALGLQGPNVKLVLSTMLAKDQRIDSQRISGLKVRGYSSSTTLALPVAYTRSIMPCNRAHIPTPEIANKWRHLSSVAKKLVPEQDCEVGLLIGYNCSKALAPKDVVPPVGNGPYGQRTELGWGIVGIVSPDVQDTNISEDPIGLSHRLLAYEVPSLLSIPDNINNMMSLPKCSDQILISFKTCVKEVRPYDVTRMMELDFIEHEPKHTPMSQEDNKFIKVLTDGIHQGQDHHYEMPMPFRNSSPRLPDNKSVALHRLKLLKARFIKNVKYFTDYNTFMQNVIDNGYAERVPELELNRIDGCACYIPHHGVYHTKKPDKIRVVFDCSAKFKGESLNDHLLQGPDLTNGLVGVLCRFRQEKIAVMCDIEQMFFQFKVIKEHRDYLRFLWWIDGDYETPPVEFRMNVHLFGAASSPGCTNFGLKQTAHDYEAECGAEAADILRHNLYVDDGLRSVASVQEAVDLINSSRNICAKGGLRLHKFVSNSKEVLAEIPQSDQAKDINQLDLFCDVLPVERALGVQWCVESDTFQFRIILKDRPVTRRGVLSTVSSIYDPLGFLAPVLLVGKQILQEMCRNKADWDTLLPDDLKARWEKWRRNLFLLEDLDISRCLKPDAFGEVKLIELHHFSDASTTGYGQCSYLRLKDDQQRVHCSFVMGKARVAPIKQVTIPRLELTAAVVSVRISALLQRELEFKNVNEFFWTDSSWIHFE